MGIKPSDLGALPPDWKAVKFGAITKVRQGLQIAISERLTKPTLTSQEYITIQSINRQNQGREYVESPSTRVTCKSDDVLMTRTGNTGIVVTGVEGAFHNNFFLIDFDRKELDSIFLVNYLRSPRVQHVLLTKAGASTIPDLNHKDFYSIDFPLAPLPEQKKIAKILSTWDKAITTTEQLLHNSQQQKKALMQQLLTGKKRLLDQNGVRFGGEWKTTEIGDFLQESRIPSKNNDPSKRLTVRLNLKGIEPREFRGTEAVESTAHFVRSAGQFIYGKQNIHKGAFGIIPKNLDAYETSQDLPAFDFTGTCDSIWFYHYMTQENFFASLEDKMSGTGSKRLNPKTFFKIKLVCPPIEEQQKIAAVLSTADQEISALQQKLDALKKEKKALMQQLLTGKRRVKVDDKEIA